jgi:hypothetical protein
MEAYPKEKSADQATKVHILESTPEIVASVV